MLICVSGMIYSSTLDFNVAVVLVSLILFPFFLIFLFIPLPEADIVNFLSKRLYYVLFKQFLA